MTSTGNLLIVFEDHIIRQESVRYGIELAHRMKCMIFLLMLLSDKFSMDKEKQNQIDLMVHSIQESGIMASAKIRCGDKASELVKFLAESPAFTMVIWGSEKWFSSGKIPKLTQHWLAKVIDTIECPIVTPTLKHQFREA
ncbi:MAG: hypothetical protein HQK77_21015 [Desulfobacterales bacterium]|nr:hypothetical protein [Desulfobacterales bacterium]